MKSLARQYLEAVLNEVEKVTAYNGLENKKALRFRLLAEELVGMLKELSGCYEGDFGTLPRTAAQERS